MEEILNRDGSLLQVPVGYSMWPMLKNRRDQIVVEKIDGKLKKYDVVLYKRHSGMYVLHRILAIKNYRYVIRGDNTYYKETDITDNEIIGRLKGVYKGNRFIDCDKNLLYRFYVIFWRVIYPLRFVFRFIYRGLKKLFGKKGVVNEN